MLLGLIVFEFVFIFFGMFELLRVLGLQWLVARVVGAGLLSRRFLLLLFGSRQHLLRDLWLVFLLGWLFFSVL